MRHHKIKTFGAATSRPTCEQCFWLTSNGRLVGAELRSGHVSNSRNPSGKSAIDFEFWNVVMQAGRQTIRGIGLSVAYMEMRASSQHLNTFRKFLTANDNDFLTKWNESDTNIYIWGDEIIITKMSEEIKSACKSQPSKSETRWRLILRHYLLNNSRPYGRLNEMIWVIQW